VLSDGRLTILVVDDEPDVAELLAATLALDQHQVDTAANGAEALGRLLERSYDVIVSDMKMPGMSGAELYREIARRCPGLERRMIFISGDSFNPTNRDFLAATGAVCVSKPFDVDELRRLVARHAIAVAGDIASPPTALRS
jgi:two-component system, NtrC family, sensor kinase